MDDFNNYGDDEKPFYIVVVITVSRINSVNELSQNKFKCNNLNVNSSIKKKY